MNRMHLMYFIFCLLILSMGSTAFSGSTSDNVNICDSEVIAQIREGESTKDDVKQLFGEPQKVEPLFSDQEIWKYKYSVRAHGSSSEQSGFNASGALRSRGSSQISSRVKNCNLHVVFEKNGIVKKVRESKVSGIGVLGH
ncbi:MAG: outer membrane protein assembly factor BamE [Deltaproteobacteria bacterium]|nr:outer membrane protein assembly factor BamE [Deltaproteobacteria bacterium]